MNGYTVHQPLPLGVPPSLGCTARVYLTDLDAGARGRVVVDCPDPRFARAVQARLSRCYGFRGRPLGPRATQDDLRCAMALGTMRPLRPVLCGPEAESEW